MNVSLSPEMQRFLDAQVKAGRYRTHEEVLAAAVAQMMEDENFEMTDSAFSGIDTSEDQIENGEVHDWKAVSAQLQRKYLANNSRCLTAIASSSLDMLLRT